MTNAASSSDWTEANQRYLTARLAVVRERVAAHAAGSVNGTAASTPASAAAAAVREAESAMPAPTALDALCAAFGLSPFERDVLLLCAGMEMDSAFSAVCGAAQGSPQRAYPTFGLALAALPDAHWSALLPAAPLRRWRLIEVGAGETLTTSPVRIDERVVHHLAGISYLDERLRALLEAEPPPTDLPPSHRALAERISSLWAQTGPDEPPVIHLGGDDLAGKRALAAMGCAALGIQLHVLSAADVPVNAAERDALLRLCEREAVLTRGALLVECDDTDNPRPSLAFLDQSHGWVLAASRAPLRLRHRSVVRVEVEKPGAAEQEALWQRALGPLGPRLDGQVGALVSQFHLGADDIRAASAQVTDEAADEGAAAARLWDACRTNARGRLEALAQRMEPVAAWSDLVLPTAQLQTLHEIAAQVRHRARVYGTWGFASKGSRGLGISALFAGVSGTGKTMAAEVLARELRLDLYRIDLSQVVSKYIGETEKNLRRVFDEAETGGAVLLFDEADALFGKRSEVKDSHDRYANIEVSYLLQRMESYRGLAVLTTNMKGMLDGAFLRRIRFIVQFPFPDTSQRAEIWRRVFPAQTPTENLDVGKLARLTVAGGSIRNIALQGAFLAADSDEPVRMGHLLRAARGEYAKLEKPMAEAESRDWL